MTISLCLSPLPPLSGRLEGDAHLPQHPHEEEDDRGYHRLSQRVARRNEGVHLVTQPTNFGPYGGYDGRRGQEVRLALRAVQRAAAHHPGQTLHFDHQFSGPFVTSAAAAE